MSDAAAVVVPAPRPIGIFRGIPAEQYHARAIDVVNTGGLKILIDKTPLHFQHWIASNDEDVEQTDAMAFGSALHCAMLEPQVFAGTYKILPANAPKDLRRFRDAKSPSLETLESIGWWDEWEAGARGYHVITAAELDQTARMAAMMRSLPLEEGGIRYTAGELIDACEKEVTLYWIDEETGLYCKARADLWSDDLAFAGDLKSCISASREAFGRVIFQRGYHVQSAHYCEGFRVLGRPVRKFTFLAMEKPAPHVCASWDCPPQDWERGFQLRGRAMRLLNRCLQTDTWPGYTTTYQDCPMPSFAHYDLNEKEAA